MSRSNQRDLQCFLWICRLVSPFSTKAQLESEMPETIRWESMIAAATTYLIAPFIHPALEQHQFLGLAPTPVRDALEALYLLNAQRNAALAGQVERVSRVLNQAGIEPIWLKGAARLISGSKWSKMRVLSDLDLWVPEHQTLRTNEALCADGYVHPEPYANGYVEDHHLAPLWREGEPAMLEVHRGLVTRTRAPVLPLGRFQRDALLFEWREQRVGVLSMPDQILNIISQDSMSMYLRGDVRARRPLEFGMLCHEYGVDRSLQLVWDVYRNTGEAAFIEQYFHWAGALFGLPGEFAGSAIITDAFLQSVDRFLFSARFPKLGAFTTGCRAIGKYRTANPLMPPRDFATILLSGAWSAVKRTKPWK